MSSTIPFTGRRACTRSIQRPLRSASAERLAAWVSTSVSNRPIWLVEAACSVTARPPTTQRMAGSCASRSASFTSSYPAQRPNTDWRNCPTRVWRPFAPVRVSVRTSPAVSLRQRASSSSRQASRPPSDGTFVPWNSSLRRRSNVRPSTAVCGSPNVASIRGTRYRPYPADNLSRTDAYCQCQTKISGKCGTSPCSCLVDAGRPRVAQRPELAARDRVRQGEGVAAEHVDVPEAQGREPGDVFGPDLVSLGAELVDRRIHVDRVPEHDEVDHEPKRAELVLLAFAVALAELAPLANNLRRAGFFGDRFLDGFMRENVSLEHRPAKFHRCSIKPGFVALSQDRHPCVGFLFRCYSDP